MEKGAHEGQQVKREKELKRRASGDGEETKRSKELKLSRGPIIFEALELSPVVHQINGILKKSSSPCTRPHRDIHFEVDESGHIVEHFA